MKLTIGLVPCLFACCAFAAAPSGIGRSASTILVTMQKAPGFEQTNFMQILSALKGR